MATVPTKYRNYYLSLLIMCFPYVFIYIQGYYLFNYFENMIADDLIRVLVVDLIATITIFIFSYIFDNSSIYDPYWMAPTIGLVLYFNEKSQNKNTVMNWLIMSPILAYCVKHIVYFFRFWPGMMYEDFRYVEFSQKIKNKVVYWVFSFFGLHVMPTLMVYFGILPTYYALQIVYDNYLYVLSGVTLSWVGLIIEIIADEQILPFRKQRSKDIIYVGLWKYSRHPNYFGDMLVWIGLFIPCLSVGKDLYWTFLGAAIILAVMNIYTLPAMERHLIKNRPDYIKYQKETSRMIPWFEGKFKKQN